MADKDRLSCITEFCKQNYEKMLYRVIYYTDDKTKIKDFFDKEGYLLPNSPDRSFSTLPLVHPSEWETIARYLRHRHAFFLLKILKNNLENRSWRPEKLLKHGEFFARIHIKDIITIQEYVWKQTSNGYAPLPIADYDPPSLPIHHIPENESARF